MSDTILHIAEHFKGSFISSPEEIREKLFRIKAFVFDWDGVFNNGMKNEDGSSPFNEIDSMGTNLMRFNHFLRNDSNPFTAIITGEKNKAAYFFATREHIHSVYYGIRYKAKAMEHFCKAKNITPEQIAFVFDDVLDFSVAKQCGLRIMVNRKCNPLLIDFAVQSGIVDYITETDGANYALREAVEMLTGLSGQYKETIENRMDFTPLYQQYLQQRNEPDTEFFTADSSTNILPKQP